jgi:lipid-A-disaccharide synthase
MSTAESSDSVARRFRKSMMLRSLGMCAGEASGDLLAAAVLAELARRDTALDARGIGGPAMARQRFQNWWSIDALSVRGYVEVLREYPRLRRMRNQLRARMIDWRPSLFVGVDAPDFNLDLEIALRAQGLRTAHFISPSIWAWRRERIERIRRAVDHMLLVFPFEQAIYDQAGIAATYVGHPLADMIPLDADAAAARRSLGLEPAGEVIALLPGSRAAEIEYLAAVFVETAIWLARRRSPVTFVIPAAGPQLFERLRSLIAAVRGAESLNLVLTQGRSHEVLAACDGALVASGTATLEAALYKKPMVIAYKMPWLSYRIMRGKAYLPFIGLPNILCGELVVPEFVQHAASAGAMGQGLLELLEAPARRVEIADRFSALHRQLRIGCAARAADVLQSLADGHPR